MTEEQMRNTMQFIIEQQAHFVADMQQVKEHIHTLTDALLSLTRVVEVNERRLTDLARETDHKIARLAELGEGTEARLNGFIAFVEKYIQNREGGKT